LTFQFGSGRYVIVDGGVNGGKPNYRRGMLQTFSVATGGPAGTPPLAVGKIVMSDYSFRISVPNAFNGTGVVAVLNRGKHLHEITLVKTPAVKTAQDVLKLIHSPAAARLRDPRAARRPRPRAHRLCPLRLPPGHYVALCLVPFGKTNKTHADAGMVGEFDVS
jgi:hypothetical protein